MFVVLASGSLTGLALFEVQHFTVIPLIQTAETYEAAQHANSLPENPQSFPQYAGAFAPNSSHPL